MAIQAKNDSIYRCGMQKTEKLTHLKAILFQTADYSYLQREHLMPHSFCSIGFIAGRKRHH